MDANDVAALLFKPSALCAHDRVTDGISLEFDGWYTKLCSSSMEPIFRLIVEARSDKEAVLRYVSETKTIIRGKCS